MSSTNRIATVAKHVLAETKPNPFRPNRACNALDSYVAYVERNGAKATAGDRCIVFLHGNPANSYLWRHVVSQVESKIPYRLLCPDLIGHGRSGDSSRGYGFFAHYDYLESWFQNVVKEKQVILCLHDWGSALGFHWARQNQSRLAGIVHMESIVGPLENWDEFPAIGRKAFRTMRETPGAGEAMVMENNFFVEKLLLGESWAAKLDEESAAVYRERFCSPVNRAPTIAWPRQIPIKGTELGPKEVIDAAEQWEKFLHESSVPKLFIPAEPGFFSNKILQKTKGWKNHHVAESPVKGLHFIQEESPNEIAANLLKFVTRLWQ